MDTGPLNIEFFVTEEGEHELHISFKIGFKVLDHPQQIETFQNFIKSLHTQAQSIDEDNDERQGLLMIMQISEELIKLIAENEIPLEETITVTLEKQNPFGNIKIIN